jgi:mono/diheme cytochrome c family protein
MASAAAGIRGRAGMLRKFGQRAGGIVRCATLIVSSVAVVAIYLSTAVAADYTAYSGGELYQRFCASCHGREAHGDGPVRQSLKVAVPDLTRVAQRHGGHFDDNWVYRVIDGQEYMLVHGPRDMPIWGFELWREQGADVTAGAKTRDLIDRLVDYLRSFQVYRESTEPGAARR